MGKGLFLFALLGGSWWLRADTVIVSQGTNSSKLDSTLTGPSFRSYLEVGWQTGSTPYSNVSISALLGSIDPGGDTFDAFLTNTIGPGATTLDEATFTIPDSTLETLTLFSGLTLAANTDYYLTIAPESGSRIDWATDATFVLDPLPRFAQTSLVLDAGVSFLSPPGYCTDDSADCSDPAPTSSFADNGLIPVFSVTAVTATSTVPEPSTAVPLALGLAALGLPKLRRPLSARLLTPRRKR